MIFSTVSNGTGAEKLDSREKTTSGGSAASAVKCEARGARRLIKTSTNGIAIIQRVLDSLSAIQRSLSDACVPHKFFSAYKDNSLEDIAILVPSRTLFSSLLYGPAMPLYQALWKFISKTLLYVI